MKADDSLFRLIKSLTTAEKGYFKKYTAKHVIGSENDYITLFNALDRMNTHDDEALRRRLAKAPFIGRIAAVKHYLNKLILESMRAFHGESTVERKLLEMLADISFLWRRNLREPAEKIINRANALALQYEEFELAQKTLFWMDIAAQAMPPGKAAERRRKHVFAIRNDVRAKLEIYETYLTFSAEIGRWMRLEGVTHPRKIPPEVVAIIQHPLMQSEDNAPSLYAKLLYNNIRLLCSSYFEVSSDLGFPFARRRYELLAERLDIIREKPKIFIQTTQQYIQRAVFLRQFDLVRPAMLNLRQVAESFRGPEFGSARTEAAGAIVMVETLYYLNSCEFAEGATHFAEWEQLLTEHGDGIGDELLRPLYFNMAILAVLVEDYGVALRLLRHSLSLPEKTRRDIVSAARLLELIVHYKLGNALLLEYAVRSVYRYLSKRERLGKIEQIVLRFLRKLPDIRTNGELRRRFVELHRDISTYSTKEKQGILGLFSFDLWLESNIRGVPFAELLRQRLLSS